MKGFLIPYIDPRKLDGHEDPMFSEYTYGDVNLRGKKLQVEVSKGDCLFFHTSYKRKRVITAYYIVEEVIAVDKAKENRFIMSKYKNPHLFDEQPYEFNTVVFGNPITSNILPIPFVLDKTLLSNLSKKLNFNPNQTDLAAMASTLRNWISLVNEDVEFLLEKIETSQKENLSKKNIFLSSYEIAALDEWEIEQFLTQNPSLLRNDISIYKQQYIFPSGKRLDLLLKHSENNSHLIVVEVKKDMITKDAYKQLTGYMKETKTVFGCSKVEGVIVCSGIHPVFEDFYLKKIEEGKIQILLYGWGFDLRPFTAV